MSPLTRKSISIALVFALRACGRAKLRGRDATAVAGVGRIQVVRVVWSGPVRPFGWSRRCPSSLFVLDHANSS